MKKRLAKKRLSRTRVFLLLLSLFLVWMVWGNKTVAVHRILIADSRIPAAFSDVQIAQISDFHNASFGEKNAVLLQKLSQRSPDLIVITGDFVDAHHTDLELALDFAREAATIAPVYYVTGNHEAALSQYDSLKAGLEAVGVVVLEDDAVTLTRGADSIRLIGLSDPGFSRRNKTTGGTASVRTTLQQLMGQDASYTILLSHRPELFETYVACGVNLVFSGHAHGGQFRLPFVGGLIAPNQGWFPPYDGGLYTSDNTNMIVSRGIGNSIIPVRFHNRPEIIFATLSCDNSEANGTESN